MRRWEIRVCKKCGRHHGRFHDGCVTYSSPMFPQMTEHAGVDVVQVVAVEDAKRAVRDAISSFDGNWDERELADRAASALDDTHEGQSQ